MKVEVEEGQQQELQAVCLCCQGACSRARIRMLVSRVLDD